MLHCCQFKENALFPVRDQHNASIWEPAGPIIVYLFLIMLAGRLLRLSWRYAVNIFFWDQWVFHDADLFQKHSLWEMFRWQFGPHRLGLGPLLSKLVEAPFHWDSRVQSYAACGVVTIAAVCAIWLKKRLFGDIALWDIVIPIVYLSATQYGSLFGTSDFAHGPLPLLLVTLYCLAWTVPNLLVRYVLVLTLNFLTIYTGFGLFLGIITPLLVGFDYWRNLRTRSNGRLYFAAGLLVSVASLGSFFIGYTLQPAVDCFTIRPQAPHRYFAFVSLMYANFWAKDAKLVTMLIGSAAVLWLLWSLLSALWAMSRSQDLAWLRKAIPVTLIAFSLLFAFNTAYGRLCLGLSSAQASHYSNYLALGLFGAYLHLLTLRTPGLRQAALVVCAVAFLATLPIRIGDRAAMKYFSEIKQNWKSCYLAGGTISECDRYAGFKIEPEGETTLQEKLQFLQRNRLNLFAGQ